jgi:AcrR family transcriptional regulator
MTIEGVATRAGVGKATIYRRWASKAEIVVEAMRCHAASDVALVDTGDVRADVLAFLRGIYDAFQGIEGPLMATVLAERIRHPELRAEFERSFVEERRAHLRTIIDAAIARGDLPPGTNPQLLADMGPALLWHYATMRPELMTDLLPEQIVDQFFPKILVPARR